MIDKASKVWLKHIYLGSYGIQFCSNDESSKYGIVWNGKNETNKQTTKPNI
jgi:hypothetical protein